MWHWYRRRRQTFTSYLAIILIAELVLLFAGVIQISFNWENLTLNPGFVVGLIVMGIIAVGLLWEW